MGGATCVAPPIRFPNERGGSEPLPGSAAPSSGRDVLPFAVDRSCVHGVQLGRRSAFFAFLRPFSSFRTFLLTFYGKSDTIISVYSDNPVFQTVYRLFGHRLCSCYPARLSYIIYCTVCIAPLRCAVQRDTDTNITFTRELMWPMIPLALSCLAERKSNEYGRDRFPKGKCYRSDL